MSRPRGGCGRLVDDLPVPPTGHTAVPEAAVGVDRRQPLVHEPDGTIAHPARKHVSIATGRLRGGTVLARECPRQADDDLERLELLDDRHHRADVRVAAGDAVLLSSQGGALNQAAIIIQTLRVPRTLLALIAGAALALAELVERAGGLEDLAALERALAG